MKRSHQIVRLRKMAEALIEGEACTDGAAVVYDAERYADLAVKFPHEVIALLDALSPKVKP